MDFFEVLFIRKETAVSQLVEEQAMNKVELGEIALDALQKLAKRNQISSDRIKKILEAEQVCPQHIPLFIRRLIAEIDWWERRCQELALQVIVYLIRENKKNTLIILSVTNSLPQETWLDFNSSCLHLAQKKKEAKETVLEL